MQYHYVICPNHWSRALAFNNISSVITQFKNNVYQVWIKEELIEGWVPRTDIAKLGANAILLNDLPSETFLSLREAASKQWSGV